MKTIYAQLTVSEKDFEQLLSLNKGVVDADKAIQTANGMFTNTIHAAANDAGLAVILEHKAGVVTASGRATISDFNKKMLDTFAAEAKTAEKQKQAAEKKLRAAVEKHCKNEDQKLVQFELAGPKFINLFTE